MRDFARPMLLLSVALSLCLAACGSNEFQPPPPPTVTVATPEVRDVVSYAEFTGTTRAIEVVEVPARIEGVLQKIAYAEGDRVEAGEVLFEIEPDRFRADLDSAAAEVAAAETKARQADLTAQRLESAYEDRAVSELQMLEARAQADAALASVDVAKARRAIAELNLSYATVKAETAGRVERSAFDVGTVVGGFGSGPLTRIHDDDRLRVWFTVPDKVALRVIAERGPGAPLPAVELKSEVDTDWVHTAQIDYVDPTADAETGTLRARAVFDNAEHRLFPGLFVRVRVAAETLGGAAVVPEEAIGADQIGRYVLVVGADDVVERRAVELGPRSGADRVITAGLGTEERIVVKGLLRARPGAKVTPHQGADS